MSLLSQFYPGGSGGPYPNLAVPPMTLGGFTSSPISRVYTLGPGTFNSSLGLSFIVPGQSFAVGAVNSGWYGQGDANNILDFFYAITVPISGGGTVFQPALGFATGMSLRHVGLGDLVFENFRLGGSLVVADLTVSDAKSIYGLYATITTISEEEFTIVNNSGSLNSWYLGDITIGSANNLVVTAPGLENTETCSFLMLSVGLMDFSGTALNQASVDKILTDNDDNIVTGTGTIDLGGGCAEPGPAGLAAAASLQSKGLTIITN